MDVPVQQSQGTHVPLAAPAQRRPGRPHGSKTMVKHPPKSQEQKAKEKRKREEKKLAKERNEAQNVAQTPLQNAVQTIWQGPAQTQRPVVGQSRNMAHNSAPNQWPIDAQNSVQNPLPNVPQNPAPFQMPQEMIVAQYEWPRPVYEQNWELSTAQGQAPNTASNTAPSAMQQPWQNAVQDAAQNAEVGPAPWIDPYQLHLWAQATLMPSEEPQASGETASLGLEVDLSNPWFSQQRSSSMLDRCFDDFMRNWEPVEESRSFLNPHAW